MAMLTSHSPRARKKSGRAYSAIVIDPLRHRERVKRAGGKAARKRLVVKV